MDWITTPVSDDDPCGPDLDATDDADFVDYYFDALGRLPDPYFTPGMTKPDGGRTPDRVFDQKSVDHAAEYGRIDDMLKRSRDIRLLVLRAQWAVLAGRLPDMAAAVKAIADGIEAFGNDMHPVAHGAINDRRDALSELGQRDSVQLPLQYVGLTGNTEVTLRRIRVADGKYTPGDGEKNLDGSKLRSMLASPEAAAAVARNHAALISLAESFIRILRACKLNETQPFVPEVTETVAILDEMRGLINDARPDLRGAEADLEAAAADAAEEGGPEAGAAADTPADDGAPAAPAAPPLPASAIRSHAEARQALLTCEVYFRAYEPSSAALLLVTQARLLIGKSLMEAMQILLPSEAGKAMIEFGPQTGFVLSTDKLKALSNEAPSGAPAPAPEPAEVGDPPVVTNTQEAAAALRGVEDFFRRSEKSSPVPILLQRARSYLDKDFQALMSELIPAPKPAAPQS